MHSYTNNTLPGSFDGLWPLNRERNVRGATLRNAGDLYIPRARLAFNARLPLHSFPKLWNNFNNEALKLNTNPISFKNSLKTHFLDDLASSVQCNRAFCRDCYPEPVQSEPRVYSSPFLRQITCLFSKKFKFLDTFFKFLDTFFKFLDTFFKFLDTFFKFLNTFFKFLS